jgi:N4-gp56 family major capsid protein
MARTSVLPSDPVAKKAWDTKVSVSATKDGFWSGKMTGTEDQQLPGVIKVDLEKNKSGDELTIVLAGKLRAGPVYGNEKAEGTEERITTFTDKIKIDKLRKFVNAGDIMTEKRTAFSMLSLASSRLSDFAAEFWDEVHFAYASGTAGTAENMLHVW